MLPNLLRHLKRTSEHLVSSARHFSLQTVLCLGACARNCKEHSVGLAVSARVRRKRIAPNEFLLENLLPFFQEPNLIVAKPAKAIFIPHRIGYQVRHVPGRMQPSDVNEIAALFI
jgi:hypothetical protein